MVASHKGRYSKYIRPISILLDIVVITLSALFFFKELNINYSIYLIYQTALWGIIAFLLGYYEIYRFTTPLEIVSKIFKQTVLFLLVVIAFFPFSKATVFSGKTIIYFMSTNFLLIVLFKYIFFYYLKKYRIITGSNFRNNYYWLFY